MKSCILVFLNCGLTVFVFAQDSTVLKESPLSLSAYAEAYYSYDFNKPSGNNRPGFVYSHNRHNEFTINLAFIKAAWQQERLRANLALAAGTYMNANYAAEPGVLKNIYEANIGYRLSDKHDWWIDVGIMPSHIGFESAVAADCWTLTRSMLADNSPYYEAGAKLAFNSANEEWNVALLALNGWQRIQRVEGNSLVSWGGQFQWKPRRSVLINYSNFIGTDQPDSTRKLRHFHNFYAIFPVAEKWQITAGVDMGWEQKEKGADAWNDWQTAALLLKYSPTEKWSLTARTEFYVDENGVIIPTGTANGFKTWGWSLNVDHQLAGNCWWRAELRALRSRDDIFQKDDKFSATNIAIATSISIRIP